MKLDVWSDIACPWCFLGKRRLEQALAGRSDVVVQWRAFELQPDLPPDGAPRSFLEAKLGGPERLRSAQAHIAALGAELGISYRFERQARVSNTRLAHRAIALAPDAERADLVDAFYRAHFEEGRDVSPLATVVEIARPFCTGCDLEAELRGKGGLDDVLADEALARELGIEGVPCFVADMRVAMSGAQGIHTMRKFLDEAGRT